MPILLNTKPTRALSEAKRMSMAQVMVAPMPTAAPLMAPMMGFLQSNMAKVTLPPESRTPSTISGSFCLSCMSFSVGCRCSFKPNTLPSMLRSMPAQNARPAPVTTMARTSSSSLARLNAWISSCDISTVNAFICSGRFSVRVRMCSATS